MEEAKEIIADKSAQEALQYKPSKVAWGTAQFIAHPPSLTTRIFVHLLLFTLISALVYSHFTEIPVSVQSRGNLVTAKALMPVYTPVSLKIKTILVKEGRRVKKGDPLLIPEDPLSESDYLKLKKDISLLETLMKKDFTKCKTCLSELTSLTNSGFKISQTGAILESIAPVVRLMRNFTTNFEQFKNLSSSTRSLRQRIRTAKSKLEQIKARGAERSLAMQVEQLQGDIASAQSALSDKKLGVSSGIEQTQSQLQAQAASLKVGLEQFRAQSTFESPIDGIVSELKISGAGQFFGAGQMLMKLVPENSRLVGEILVANEDVARIKSGMKARIKLDAFPEREYGVLNAEVQQVARTATDAGAQGTGITGYKVRIGLDKQSFQKSGKEYPFRMGMSLTGLIITRYDSLLSMAIKKILNIKDDLIGY